MSTPAGRARRIWIAALAACLLTACAATGAGGAELLHLLPLALFALALSVGRYPGEVMLVRRLGSPERRRRRRLAMHAGGTPRPAAPCRGGLLIGLAIAVRPPPARPAAR